MQNANQAIKGPPDVDMSPEAITQRLRTVGQLWKLGMSIRKARYIGPVNPPPTTEQQASDRRNKLEVK